jgi:hypothetical protein
MNGTAVSASTLRKALALSCLTILCAGCASMQRGPSPSHAVASQSDSERSRAERVFLYQSRVSDALLDRYPLVEVFEQADPVLIAAEARMMEHCGYLTRAVLAHVEGRETSLALKLKVMNSIDDCEHSAQQIDRLLEASKPASTADESI